MPGTTPTYSLPYQELTDAPDGASLGEDLALAVETELARIDSDITTVEATLDTVDSLGSRTGVRLRRAAAQSVADATQTDISWDTEDEDTDAFWSSGATVTIPTGLGGIYAITYVPVVASLTAGSRAFGSIVPSSSITGGHASIYRALFDSQEDRCTVAVVLPLLAGDSFTCNIFHSQGASRDVTAHLSCYRIGV